MMNKLIVMNKQKGAALVTALVLMSAMTVIGIASMRSNVMDVRIQNNMHDRGNAFQCAEAALRDGEKWLEDLRQRPDKTYSLPQKTSGEVYFPNAPDIQNIAQKDQAWWQANGWTYGVGLEDPEYEIGCADEPRYIVEDLGAFEEETGAVDIKSRMREAINYYRVTAYSVGRSENAWVVLQSTFRKRFN